MADTVDIEAHLVDLKERALAALDIDAEARAEISLADTPDPSQGDRGFPVFTLARILKKAPQQIAQDVVAAAAPLVADSDLVAEVLAVGPYVNFRLDEARLAEIVIEQALEEGAAFGAGFIEDPAHVMIEFSAPNTNKPQHLGHVRNDLLGESVTRILRHAGHTVTPVNLINDRGIHICKSMLAYKRFGNGETPGTSGKKGDHLVGHYYVVFNTKFQTEYRTWQQTPAADERFDAWLQSDGPKRAVRALGEDPSQQKVKAYFFKEYEDEYFNNESDLGRAAKEMLVAWEESDEEVMDLWRTMNEWVFDGFDVTYERLGVHFDRVYYESDTYVLGKGLVQEGLDAGIFREIEGGAIACDLSQIGMQGDKVLLRSDGTSVYMTQDLGTALQRFEDVDIDEMIYVVGDEQRYHFKVLFGILGLLRPELKGKLSHLSYGMVELPHGRMKSREGTVVDADDLMDEMHQLAHDNVRARYEDLEEREVHRRAEIIGMTALKYFILDYNPKTTVSFDPDASIKPEGRTGPYMLYSFARIQSIARNVGGMPELTDAERRAAYAALGTDLEKAVLAELRGWPRTLEVAARDLDPSKITDFMFRLCKTFSSLFNDAEHKIIDLEGPRRHGLLLLTQAVANAVSTGLYLIGVDEALEQM